MKVNGRIIKCMEVVFSLGLMEEGTMESTMMTKSKVMEYLHGLMAENMMDNGSTVNNMVKEYITPQKVK